MSDDIETQVEEVVYEVMMGAPQPDVQPGDTTPMVVARAVSRRLSAAGYRPPARVITTTAELDALGFNAVVLDPRGDPAVCQRSGLGFCDWLLTGVSSGLIDSATLLMVGESCTVLWEGQA